MSPEVVAMMVMPLEPPCGGFAKVPLHQSLSPLCKGCIPQYVMTHGSNGASVL